MVHSGQLTWAADGQKQLSTGYPTPQNQSFANLVIQNNGVTGNARFGDKTVTSAKGIILSPGAPGGSGSVPLSIARGLLTAYYVWAPNGTVIDYCWEDV